MSTDIFTKFNENFDIAGLQEDIANAGTTTFEEVPHGDYEVSITKLELGESKKGLPQAKVWFKIVAGDFKGQLIFMNQNLTSGFQIHTMNTFLEHLDSGYDIVFQDFVQYANLMASAFEAIKEDEYQLSYTQNAKGFNVYTIVQKFKK